MWLGVTDRKSIKIITLMWRDRSYRIESEREIKKSAKTKVTKMKNLKILFLKWKWKCILQWDGPILLFVKQNGFFLSFGHFCKRPICYSYMCNNFIICCNFNNRNCTCCHRWKTKEALIDDLIDLGLENGKFNQIIVN